jgi:hypothetical protein
MQNKTLAADYIKRAKLRLLALDTLFEGEGWADVVRESQEVVELTLKALLRHAHIEVPRVHDVGDILLEHRDEMPATIRADLEKLAEISRQLRRDRELAFYGSEDLTPSDFYKKSDAKKAREQARWTVEAVSRTFTR